MKHFKYNKTMNGRILLYVLTYLICHSFVATTEENGTSTVIIPSLPPTNTRGSGDGTLSSHHSKAKQRKIIISTVLEEPYVMLRQSGMFMTGNDRFHGYLVDLLNKISSNIGLQHEIRLSRDGKHGELIDGVWDGSIGDVLSGAADVAAGPLIVDDQKRHYVDFSEPFLTLRSSALIRRPRDKNKTNADRVPSTVDELLHDMEYLIGVLRDGPAQRSLSTSTDPLHRTAWARTTSSWPSGIVDGIQEGIERARREKFAFVVDSPISEYVAGRKPCDLLATEPFLDSVEYAFVLRKGDRALLRGLDKSLRQMRDNSELQSLYLRWWKDECKRFHASPAVQRPDSNTPEKRIPLHRSAQQQPTSPPPDRHNSSPFGPRFRSILLSLPFLIVPSVRC